MMEESYLNYSHAPIVLPLKKSQKIEIYNDTYFSPHTITMDKALTDHPSNNIDLKAFAEHKTDILLPAEQLFHKSGNDMPTTNDMDAPTTTPSQKIGCLLLTSLQIAL